MTTSSDSSSSLPDGFDEPTGPAAHLAAQRAAQAASSSALADDGEVAPVGAMEADLSARIAALEAALADTRDQYLRAVAEVDNIRKRSVKEREDANRYAVTSFARDLLDVSDNLRRALEAIPADVAADPKVSVIVEGVSATERELLRTFTKHGIRKLEPHGEQFDPHYHEVMFEAPGTGKPAGTIIHLVDAGYVLHDRLLRPARVGVAKAEAAGASAPAQGGGFNQEV